MAEGGIVMEGLPFCSALELNTVFKLLLAILLGGAIGLEREFRGRPAGLRTHILVCLGSTIIMIASQRMAEVSPVLSPVSRITVDPGRIAAGIVTGIGFLGAGAIIRIGDLIRGLTTAGCIWFVAALGISIGQGWHFLAIVSTLLALGALLVLSRAERRIQPIVYRCVGVIVSLAQAESIEKTCRALLGERKIHVQDIANKFSVDEGRAEITFKIRARHQLQSGEVLRVIAALPGVIEASWT
jgi:putative Mg2+ transporter-C (MgtC) family protein